MCQQQTREQELDSRRMAFRGLWRGTLCQFGDPTSRRLLLVDRKASETEVIGIELRSEIREAILMKGDLLEEVLRAEIRVHFDEMFNIYILC